MEEEWLQLNVEEFVPDPGQEAGAGATQLGVYETSANIRDVFVRFNSSSSRNYCKKEVDGLTVE